MEKLLITGGKKLQGDTVVSGAKNAALKALVAATLTDGTVIIKNIPLISDFFVMVAIIRDLGGEVVIDKEAHTATIKMVTFTKDKISLDEASHIRTSAMFLAPMLHRIKHATIPNPGGCRLGARPIDRIIQGIVEMGADIVYDSDDGYFHASAEKLHGIHYTFSKNTHTGTETLIIAAVLATGKTILENAAAEPEIDELIHLLNSMGAKVTRTEPRKIEIEGVAKLHGATVTISPDRNEIVTLAIAGIITKGDVFIKEAKEESIADFLQVLAEAGGGYEIKKDGIRFFYTGPIHATNVVTNVHPGFMTDWQAPWTVLMTQAEGVSTIHETVFENKLEYIADIRKMGAKAQLFNPEITDFDSVYNFNKADDKSEYFHAVKIEGPTPLHDAIVTMHNIRAGAAVVLAALAAKGETSIHNVDLLDRGYEQFDERLRELGADIKRTQEKS